MHILQPHTLLLQLLALRLIQDQMMSLTLTRYSRIKQS